MVLATPKVEVAARALEFIVIHREVISAAAETLQERLQQRTAGVDVPFQSGALPLGHRRLDSASGHPFCSHRSASECFAKPIADTHFLCCLLVIYLYVVAFLWRTLHFVHQQWLVLDSDRQRCVCGHRQRGPSRASPQVAYSASSSASPAWRSIFCRGQPISLHTSQYILATTPPASRSRLSSLQAFLSLVVKIQCLLQSFADSHAQTRSGTPAKDKKASTQRKRRKGQ